MEYEEFDRRLGTWLKRNIREPLEAVRICMWDEEERLREGIEICDKGAFGSLYLHLDLEKMYRCSEEEGWKSFQDQIRSMIRKAGFLNSGQKKAQDYRSMLPDSRRELFDTLRGLRSDIARENSWPAYVVCSNLALFEMAGNCPSTLEELMELKGVGEKSACHFGRKFLDEIHSYEKKHPQIAAEKTAAASEEEDPSFIDRSPKDAV